MRAILVLPLNNVSNGAKLETLGAMAKYISLRITYLTGSNSTNTEILGDDLPSRMRTRNKPTKDQPSSKRPKRGAENSATDTQTETTKTPNKTSEKRKSTRDTPTKGKKRTNIDMDTDNDGSDEKEKRKRTDVSVRIVAKQSLHIPLIKLFPFVHRVRLRV